MRSVKDCAQCCAESKPYLRSSMTQEPVASCFTVTTYKKQVDKLKSVEPGSQYFSKMNIAFQLKNRYFPRKFTQSAAKGTQTPNLRCSYIYV